MSACTEHHTADPPEVCQDRAQGDAHRVGRLRRDHLRALAQRVEVDAKEVRISAALATPKLSSLRPWIKWKKA
jgi:septum formation topological specificity factor MinE